MYLFDDNELNKIADALADQGYLILDNSLPKGLLQGLLAEFNTLRDEEFKSAGIGRQTDFQVQETIRADKIHWISATNPTTSEFLAAMEVLREGLNQRLFLGLFDYESHFAFYPVGAFYKKHVDAFRSKRIQGANRVLSTVLYLNHEWSADAGGELVIYAEDDAVLQKVQPVFGRLVIFLSEKFPHEVLPANRERRSIAGWFRVNEGLR